MMISVLSEHPPFWFETYCWCWFIFRWFCGIPGTDHGKFDRSSDGSEVGKSENSFVMNQKGVCFGQPRVRCGHHGRWRGKAKENGKTSLRSCVGTCCICSRLLHFESFSWSVLEPGCGGTTFIPLLYELVVWKLSEKFKIYLSIEDFKILNEK